MSIKSLIILVFLGLLILALGAFLGVLYQSQFVIQSQPQTQNNAIIQPPIQEQKVSDLPDVIKVLSSKVIPLIAAYGTVTKIDGKNITLSYQTDSIIISIRDDAKIYSLVLDNSIAKPGIVQNQDKKSSTSKQIDFKDIKIGDNLNVDIKVLPNGQVKGFSAVALPPF